MSAAARDSVMITETFKALAKAVKRKAYDSDSDDYIEHATNRGGKLKKRARFVRQGQLGPPNGPATYKEVVEHAGYHRTVISRNPPLIDEEGYEIDSEDDQDRIAEAQTAAEEEDPYAGIRIEDILAPLTSAADLANHPTLSQPFISAALTELTTQGLGLLHKEREALWNVRPLLTRLCGDHTWASCNMMLAPDDEKLFSSLGGGKRAHSRTNAPAKEATKAAVIEVNGSRVGAKPNGSLNGSRGNGEAIPAVDKTNQRPEEDSSDVTMEDVEPAAAAVEGHANGHQNGSADGAVEQNGENRVKKETTEREGQKGATNGAPVASATKGHPTEPAKDVANATNPKEAPAIHQETNGALPGHPDGSADEVIHPYFMAPASSYPNRDAGLPENEADEVRRLLQMYVQKQEEVCRGTQEMYEGLLRAERMRREVMKWSKAEAHCGANRDMSDGEDWYDKEEWGLVEDLKKGQDEEEEDTTTRDQPKKTRNRR